MTGYENQGTKNPASADMRDSFSTLLWHYCRKNQSPLLFFVTLRAMLIVCALQQVEQISHQLLHAEHTSAIVVVLLLLLFYSNLHSMRKHLRTRFAKT